MASYKFHFCFLFPNTLVCQLPHHIWLWVICHHCPQTHDLSLCSVSTFYLVGKSHLQLSEPTCSMAPAMSVWGMQQLALFIHSWSIKQLGYWNCGRAYGSSKGLCLFNQLPSILRNSTCNNKDYGDYIVRSPPPHWQLKGQGGWASV